MSRSSSSDLTISLQQLSLNPPLENSRGSPKTLFSKVNSFLLAGASGKVSRGPPSEAHHQSNGSFLPGPPAATASVISRATSPHTKVITTSAASSYATAGSEGECGGLLGMQDDDVEALHWALRSSMASSASFTQLETINETINPESEATPMLQRSFSRGGLRSGCLNRSPSLTSVSVATSSASALRPTLGTSTVLLGDGMARTVSWSQGDIQRQQATPPFTQIAPGKLSNAAAAAVFPALVSSPKKWPHDE